MSSKSYSIPPLGFHPTPQYWGDLAASVKGIWEGVGEAMVAPKGGKALSFLAPISDTMVKDFQEFGLGLFQSVLSNPFTYAQQAQEYWREQQSLLYDLGSHLLNRAESMAPSVSKTDKRFQGQIWDNNHIFHYLKQSYLLTEKKCFQVLEGAPFSQVRQKKRVEFFINQFFNFLAPGNFAGTNPLVWEKIKKTGGINLLKGMRNFMRDLQQSSGPLRIQMSDPKAFQVGKNIACTPGSVIFQNDLMQLIYYKPVGPQVFEVPLLVIPPWINKYYVLDLQPHNSFVRWAVEQGYQVFMVSWVNPDEKLAQKTFEDYMTEGPLAALEAIKKQFKVPAVNLLGYCLGGTLLACALAYFSQKGSPLPIQSATLLTTLVDFQNGGDLSIFIEDEILASVENQMNQQGYMDGEMLASTFNSLKSTELFWSFFEKNYLLGERPGPFDLLYWNSNPTRLPYGMQQFYLRNMYQKNLLAQPQGLTLGGVGLDLGQVTTPLFMVSTKEDHIAPWKGTYAATHLFKNVQRFLLGESGHVAGIINPPTQNKYGYWENSFLPPEEEEWMASAAHYPGSWWPAWEAWLSSYGGKKVSVASVLRQPFSFLEEAPGSYVAQA
jgi:polyhydroxyalkanoate synthase